MTPERLLQLLNPIAAFHAAEPDPDLGRQAVASHLRRYWTPAMRRELLKAFDAGNLPGLNPLAAETLRLERARIL